MEGRRSKGLKVGVRRRKREQEEEGGPGEDRVRGRGERAQGGERGEWGGARQAGRQTFRKARGGQL